MLMHTKNIFELPEKINTQEELFEALVKTPDILIERIISAGQVSPPGFWYDQEKDEWVVLLQGNAVIEYDNGEKNELFSGDYLFIPSHQRHRIAYTSADPACIWLAIHGKLQ